MNSVYAAFIISEVNKGNKNSAEIARKLNGKYGSKISRHSVYRYIKKIKPDISDKKPDKLEELKKKQSK